MVGRENEQILVKYGGLYLRVHACRLQHFKDMQKRYVNVRYRMKGPD